jgi:hypothetical protein
MQHSKVKISVKFELLFVGVVVVVSSIFLAFISVYTFCLCGGTTFIMYKCLLCFRGNENSAVCSPGISWIGATRCKCQVLSYPAVS